MRGLANGRKKQLASFRPVSRAARSATSHSRRACPKLAERGLSEDAVTAILDREAASWFDGKQIVVRSDAARCAGREVLAEINQLRAPRGRDLKARTRGPKSAAWRAKYVRGSVQRRTRENDGLAVPGGSFVGRDDRRAEARVAIVRALSRGGFMNRSPPTLCGFGFRSNECGFNC